MRILLIDFNAAIHMHFHIKDKHPEYGYIKNIREVCQRFKIDRCFTLQDGGYAYRSSIYPQYKAQRAENRAKKTEAEQAEYAKFRKDSYQFSKTVLPMLGMQTLRVQSVEADDLASFLSRHLSDQGHQVLNLSSDKDWFQLLGPKVVQASYTDIMKSDIPLPASLWMNATKFEEKYGLKVDQWIWSKALHGDSGDNVSGAATKLGEVTATKLLQKYGTIENIKANKDNLDIPRMAQVTKDTLNFDTVDLNYKVMNLNHTPEEELLIIGRDGIDMLNRVIADIEKPAELDTTTFKELCFEKGWLTFVEQEEFFTPFISK